MKRLAGLAAPFTNGVSKKIISLLFLFGVAPLMILATVFLVFYIERELIHIEDIQKEIVERISSDISSYVEDRLNDLRLFANISNLRSVDRERMDMLTSSLLDMEKEVDVITIADLKGNVISKISRYYSFASSELGSIIKDESFLAASEGKIHISEIEFSKFTNLPQLYMTLPIRDIATNKVTGVLQVAVNVGRMWELVSSYRIGEERYAYIVDHDGYLIIHKDIATVLQKKDLKHIQIVKDLINDKAGIFSYSGLTGDRVIGASASIPLVHWGVIVEEPVRSAYKGLIVFSFVVILALLLTVSLAIAIGMRFSFRFIINPIKRLQEGAEAIASGEFDKKIVAEGTDEIGQLAQSFNVMTDNLQTTTVSRDRLVEEIEERKKAEVALRETEEKYRDLASSADAMYLIDRECRYQLMNDAHLLRLGVSLDQVKGRSYGEFHSEEDLKQFAEIIEAVFKTGKSFQKEQHGQTDGSFFLRTFSPVKNSQGNTTAVTVISKDITELKSAEKRIDDALQFNQTILAASPVGILTFNSSGQCVSANETASKITGGTIEALLAQNFRQLESWKSAGMIDAAENALKTEQVQVLETHIVTTFGKELWFDCRFTPFHHEGELHLLVLVSDITWRKQAEEALRESEKRYRELTDLLPISIFEIDAAGSLISFNRTAFEVFRYNQEDYKEGMNALQLFLPEEWQRVGENIGKVLQGTPVPGQEYTLLRKDGSTFIGLVYASPIIRENKPVGIRGAIIDITERKRVEEALNETNETLSAIIQSSPLAIISLDPEGNVTRWNPAAEKMFGWLESEVLGQFPPYVPEDKRDEHLKLRERVLRGEGFTDIETHRRKKDGTPIDISVSTAPLRGYQGCVYGIMSVSVDITERKRDESERRRLEDRLQRAEKMQALGTLAGGVAHDLNNVLGVLVGYSELLLQNVPQESPFHRHAMQIFKGGQRAAAIIQDLLTLTRRGVLVSETLNLNRIILDFMQMPEFEAIKSHHPGVQFKTSLEAELLNIKGSSTHLNKTVMNLLSNAAEAISGSGEVLIRTENRYLDRPIHGYDTAKEGEYAVLTVSDTGSGISPADLGRIFEPFYTKKVMGRSGTGLGLAVVWGTVKDHDGYIDVQSAEGKGSIFTLYFPVTREDLTKAEQVVPQSTYMGRGEHILVVDDVEGQRLLASAMLDSLGYKVSSVASGEEAIEFVKKQPVDLLILDMIMDPGMDGLDTYRSILAIRPKRKAIIVSGYSETDRVKAAQSLGAGTYVRKPYVIEKLGLAVKKELDRK
ncbi:MAG: PAS domain S-box protein [Syntrophales bacterium]